MKHIKRYSILIIAILLLLSFNVASFAFGFYDTLNYAYNQSGIQIGNWYVDYSQYSKFFDFETFSNTQTNRTITVTLNGVSWSMYNMVRASGIFDKKIGSRSIKCSKTGYLRTSNYYTYLETLSFYVASNKTASNGTYVVELSSNNSNWTQISSGTTTTTLSLKTINVKTLLKNGVTLSDSTIANYSTPLMFRIYFNKANSGGSITFYCDNLTFVYNILTIY
jgi:FlaG/FlaF family flagellin (archaellin)